MKLVEWIDGVLRNNFVNRVAIKKDRLEQISNQENRTASQARELEALKRAVIAQKRARRPNPNT